MEKTLKELRKEKGIKQKDMAHMCYISPAYYSFVENGERIPSMQTSNRIAAVLNITLDQFFEAFIYTKKANGISSRDEMFR